MGDPASAARLLALTGLEPADLSARAADPAVHGAVLGLLESHEPDLLACADALAVSPAALVDARRSLGA